MHVTMIHLQIENRTSGGLAVSDSLSRQARGVNRKGVESRLDVVTRDYVPPQKHEIKRSKSSPAVRECVTLDRFVN